MTLQISVRLPLIPSIPFTIDMNSHSAFTDFPVIVEPPQAQADVLQWINNNRLQTLEQLQCYGAVLLRGFDLVTDLDFDAAVSAFDLPTFTYAGSLSNAVRMNRTDKVFTANEAPSDIEIFLHHEMAQTPRYPSKLFFFCEQAPDSGGATPLCRSDLLLTEMKRRLPVFVAHCASKGLRYTNVMPLAADSMSGQGRSWGSTLNCAEVAQAETRLRELGYNWQWLEDGSLQATTRSCLRSERRSPELKCSSINS